MALRITVSGLSPTSNILKTRKYSVSETGCVSALRREEGDTYSVGSLRKSNRTMDKVQKPSDSECSCTAYCKSAFCLHAVSAIYMVLMINSDYSTKQQQQVCL
jgi:hypothetical protein